MGSRAVLEASKDYPKRSYYKSVSTVLILPADRRDAFYPAGTDHLRYDTGIEYWAGRERGSQVGRHTRVFEAIHEGLDALGFHDVIRREWQSGLVVSVKYPR